MTLLETKSVSISVGGKPICRNLNFRLEQDECWGILGINGIGKTTLLHVLAGLKQPDAGRILIENLGLNVYSRKSLAKITAMLFQDSDDSFPCTVLETVLTGRYPHLPFWSLESAADIELSKQALDQVALLPMAGRQVNTLSGGERRRLAIATLIVQQPRIWLLDEPTNHLDLHHQIKLLEMIVNRVFENNGAAMMVLHDVNLLTRFCTHALLMINADTFIRGPVAAVVTTENLERLYRHPVRMMEADGTRLFYPV